MTPPEKGKEVKTADKAEKPAESVFDQFILVKDEKKDKPAETKAADAASKAADAAPAKVDVADAGEKRKQDGPATPEDIERLKRAVEEADKLDPKKAIADVLEAQTHSIELLDVLMRPSQKQNPEKQEQLKTVFEAVEGKGWENYLKYLAPGSARAALALAQIGTGDDKSIREGEKGLVEAVKLRPELALNPEFQKRVADAYRQMAEWRDDAGKPPWDEPIKMPEMADGKDNTATIQRVQELMGSANQAYGEKGIDAALPVFKQAQDATKEIDPATVLKEHVELFVERMQRDRQISALERQGRDTQPLVDAQEQHLEKQWQKYGEYLLPASVVSNIGLAEINSGKPELMSDGRLRLGQAIELRPEMQFNNDYAKVVKGAFENYYSKNPDAVTTAGGAPVGPGGLLQPADLDPKFKQLDGKDIASHPTADLTQDKKLESYVWDDITGPALTAGLLYLGYRQVKGQIQRYREAKAEREADDRGSVKSIPGGDLLSPKDSGPDMPFKYTAERPAAELVQGIDKFLERIPAADRAALRQDLSAIDKMAPDVAKILAKQGIKSSDFQSMTTEEVARKRNIPAEDLQKLVDYKKMAKSLDDRLYKYNQPLQEALGIKDVRLRLSPTMHDAAGKFNFTNGFMDLRAQEIFAEHLSPELIGTIKHESRHVEQSRLIMRHLMGEELKGNPLTKEGQDKIFERFVKAFPGANQYDIDRNYFNRVLQEFASQPNGTDRLDAADRARAKQLIESLKAPINYELEKLEKPVRKIIEERNELRQEGAKEFANKHKLTPQNEAAWKALFGDKIPAEVDDIRKRGVTDADTQVLDKHLNERTYELANKVLEKYNSYAHEAEASRTGGKAIEETKKLFAETGRTIPPERGRGVIEQALKPIRFDLVDERTKIMEGMIHELKGKNPDIVSMIEYLDEKRPDGQKNVDFLFGKDKPKEIAALLEPQTKDLILREEHPQLNDEKVAKILRDGIEKAHAAELAAAEKPAVDKPAVQSPADKPAQVEATAKDKLQIGATLLSESTISKMNERVTQVLPELNRVPEQAGNRLKNAVFDVLTQAGVNDSRISKDRTEIVFNKDAKESSVKYFTGEAGTEVTRKGADFVTASGAPVEAAKVKTQIVLPQSMMSGNPAELTRTVYDALLQQANRGSGDAADRAGIDRVVRSALRDNLPLPGKPGGGVEVNDRLIGSQLPLESLTKPVEIKVTEQGVRFAGVEREIPFKEVWGKHVTDLERELKNEQAKKEGRDEKRIAELEKSVASEKAFLAALSDPAHADHAKTVERARERLSEFRPTEAQVERLAKERGATGEMRSRLVALTVLLGAFLTSKAFGDEPKKDKPAAGSSTDKPAAGTTAGAATDQPIEPSSETTDHRVRDVSDRASEKQNLADLPNSQMMRTALERILPSVNEAIQKKNEGLSEKNQQAKIDENKLRLEWEKGEFGSESRRLWKEAQKFLEADSIHLMQAMDARGMKYPVGAPVGPAKSESGSGLKETDELFRDRLRAGKVKVDLGFHNLNAGDLPTDAETTKFLNTYMWVAEAGQQYSKAFIQGQATYLDHSIQSFANMSRSGNLEGWKAPKDATPEQLERWQVAAVPWMQTIAQVKDYSERVAAFNAATTTNGTDWPSLQGIFKKIHGLDGKDFSFPDDAIKDANFPGKVIRNADGSVKEVKLDLPANLDRTPENIAKMEKLEAWLKKWSPQVDQVSGEIAKAMMDDNKLLLWAEAGDLQTDKKVPGYELRNVNKDLKGNQSDVGKFVQLPDGGPDNKKQSEWKVKAVREDGSYDLVRSAPNGKEFNLKRYEFSTVACDKDGKPNPKGEYVKVQSYEDMLWARDYAYNNWDFLGSIQKAQHVDREAQVFHKNDFVPIVDNGRVRLLQAKNLDSWGSSQEGAKQTGNIAGAVVDVGMLAIGVGEARAAWLVAKESGAIAMRQIVKEGLKATWHIGLGATGFGKQAIVNHFGDAGRTFMQYRHYAIMADLTLQLAPKGLQEGLWNSVWATKGMPSVMETYSGLNNLTWFDKALKGVNQVYEGGQLVKYTPPVGLFPLVDYYYLADFSNTIARVGQQKQEWPKLVDAMLKQGDGYREGEKPLFLSNDRITPEEMKRIAGLSLTDYQEKLQARDQKGVAAAVTPDVNGKRATDLMERSKEALFKPENDPSRQKLASDAVEVFRNPQASQEDRTAAAFLLLSMRKSDIVGERIGGANGVTATEAFGQLRSMANSSTSPFVRMAAGDMLLKTARTADATTATLARSVGDLETRAKQNPADKQIAGELSATRKRLEEAEQFKKSVNYSSADYVSVLTSIVNNKNLPRAVRMEAIASPTGPRLAALMQQFRYEVEPQIQATSDIEKRTTQMAAIYGRDSVAMEKTLSAIAKNAGEDADLRALATQALSGGSLDRPTVNGRPITPGDSMFIGTAGDVPMQGDGIQDRHAAVALTKDGQMMVRTVGTGDTWIVHPDGSSSKVGSDWTRIAAGDRVRLGDKDKGQDLFLGQERTESLARMGAEVKNNRDKQGAIAQEYAQQITEQLKAKTDLASFSSEGERNTALVNKYRATLAAIEMGPSLTGGDVNQFNRMVADALAECTQASSPELAANALAKLTPERMASLSFTGMDAMREGALRLVSGGGNEAKDLEFKRLMVERFPDIFKDGTTEQKVRARNMLECLLVPGADVAIGKQDPSINYPLYAAGDPALRISALNALTRIDSEKAAEVAKLKLFGGTYGGAKVEADVATVRMAALETLQKIQPMDLGAISLKALKTETDPAILAKLWDVEYQERRPDLDPVRMMREYEALRERLLQRSQPGLLEEGKRAMEAAGYKGMHHVDLVNKLQGQAYGGYKGDINSQEAKDARKALIYMIVHERVSQQAMATNLKQAMWVKGPEMAKEMAVPLEMAMLSSPAMYADARNELLSAYLSLKPIEGGVISKEESTMLYASMLENEVRRMPAKDGTDWLKYDKRESETLQLRLLQLIADQPTDKVLPIIEGMSGTEHPFPSVQAKINEVLGQLKGSTDLYKQAAEHEARFIRQEKEAGRTPTSDFGKAKNASQLADAMGAVLTSKDSDAAKVSKALYLGMNLSPVTRADDPRLVVLRMASRDSNETVRLVAAKLLNTSPNGGDKQRAAFVAADTIKNSPIPSLKKEAETLGKEIGAKDQKLMDRALAETVVAPRNEASARPQGGEGIDDVRNQRAFERVRRSLVSGPKAELTWDWEQWGDFTKKYKFNLLESGSFVSAQFEAARQVDENRGGLTSFFTRESTKEAERQAAKDAVVPKMWEQLNGLVSMAMEKGDLDPDGREARKALNYLLLDDALAFYNRDQAKALDIVVNGLEKMAKGNSPGRGDMEWVLKAALTEKPDLKLEHKIKLLSALDALGGDKGKLSNENVAGIVALAMEQEYRFMPKPGDPTFAAKVEYHKQLLGMMEKYGNRDLSAALNIYIQNHPDQSVRAKAAQVRDAIEQRSSAGVKALVSNMVADTGATRKFAPIRDAKDPRIPMLLETAQDVKQPIEQRNRAASILLSPDNKGVSAEIRRTAANSVVTNGLALPDLGSRYTTAMKILDHTNNQFTREDKFKAISTLADLSVRGSNEIAERSDVALAKLQGEEASKAMKALLDSVSNSKRGTAEEKAKTAHTLEVVMKLYGGCTNEQKDFTLPHSSSMIDGQAQLFRAAALVAETGNQELIDRYHSTISSAAKAPSLVPVTSSSDVRLAALKDSLVSNDEQVKLSAALILSHADSTGANPSLKTEARKTVYEHIDSRVFETRRAESDATSAADLVARWNNIDSVLGAAGEAPDSFARSYTRMKQMELQGGKEKDLVPVYERLAQLSKERQAPQAASQFQQKAGLAKLISEHATEFRTADAGFKQAQQLATEATTSKQPAKLAEAEQKLNQAVQTYSTLAGNDSVFAADALTALGKFYASNGRSREADQATQKALAIYEAQAAKSLVAPDATPSANGSGETSIDSVLMRGAVEYDAAKAGQDLMARSVVARTGAFGEASVSAAEGYEKLADFYSRTGSAFKGAPVLQTAVSIYQNYPGMEAKVGQASQQLARAYEATGDYQKAEDAYESGIQAMMKPNAIVSQQEVLRHMTTYIDMCRRHGRADKAAQWSQKMSQLQKPSTTGSTKSMLPFS